MEDNLLYTKRMMSMLEKLTGTACQWDPLWEKNYYPFGYQATHSSPDEPQDLDDHNYLYWRWNRDTTEFVTSLARAIQSGNSIKVSKLIADIKNGLKPNKDAQGISEKLLNPNSNLDYELDKDSIYFGDLAKTPEEYEQAAFKLISNYWAPFCGENTDFFNISK